jgi:hypothetical protein
MISEQPNGYSWAVVGASGLHKNSSLKLIALPLAAQSDRPPNGTCIARSVFDRSRDGILSAQIISRHLSVVPWGSG